MPRWSRSARPAGGATVEVALAAVESATVEEFRHRAQPLLAAELGTSAADAVLAGDEPDEAAGPLAHLAAAAVRRLGEQKRLRASEQRLADAQALAHMGSYDWDIASDTNSWSDELYRIYGSEPQSFNASYERFLSFIHPDDRQRIIEVHQQAYASGAGYSMEERICRPTGEVRYLLSTGEVVLGLDGSPARMRGICWDITERQLAEDEVRRNGERLAAVVAGAPEGVLVLDEAGCVCFANDHAEVLLGWGAGELPGLPAGDVFPEAGLPEATGVPLATAATRRDGSSLPVDLHARSLSASNGPFVAVYFQRSAAGAASVTPLPGHSGGVSFLRPRSASR